MKDASNPPEFIPEAVHAIQGYIKEENATLSTGVHRHPSALTYSIRFCGYERIDFWTLDGRGRQQQTIVHRFNNAHGRPLNRIRDAVPRSYSDVRHSNMTA